MNRPLIAVGLLAGIALLSCRIGHAQTHPAALPIAVNEAKARAILEQDAIEVLLPLTAPAGKGMRAVAWLVSPTGTPSGETDADLAAGSRSARLTLAWPKDSHGEPVEEIGWYRIAYRIEAAGTAQEAAAKGSSSAQMPEKPTSGAKAPVDSADVTRGLKPPPPSVLRSYATSKASGILAVGGIAANLLDLRMASPERMVSGMPLSVRVYAGNPVTREPFRGVHLEARLELKTDGDGKDAPQAIVREAFTGRAGEAILSFPMPAGPGQPGTLTVKGTLTGVDGPGSSQAVATASVEANIEPSAKTTIRVETDKPLHKPGETVHLRALVFDDAGHAAANTALTLTLRDQENKTLLEAALTTNKFGIAAYDWKTGTQLAPGDYDATFAIDAASDNDGSASTPIRIERYELPEFAVSAAMDRGYYLEGETPTVRIHAGYLFGKPVAAGTVRIVRASQTTWDWKTGKSKQAASTEQTAPLDANGDAELRLEVKSDFDDFKPQEYERFSDLEYRALVTDASTGRSEPRNFTVRLSREPVHIYFDKQGGNEREGDYIVTTSYADGTPAACKVTLDWMEDGPRAERAAAVVTNRYGLARLHLRYPEPGQAQIGLNLRLIAHDAEGRDSKLDETINPSAPGGLWIAGSHTVLKPGEPIEAVLHGAAGSAVDVDALAESGLVAHYRVRMSRTSEPLTVPALPAFRGLVTLRAYQMNGDLPQSRYEWMGRTAYKAVLYPEDRELKVKVAGLQASYLPGAAVDAVLNVRQADGAAAASALGVAAIDTAVEQRAATEEEANQHWFGWNWWQEGGNVGGVTREALDRIDTSKPIPDDLDLAAEKLLANGQGAGIQIDANYDSTARNEYETAMEKALKPIGEAVLATRPEHLPAEIDAVKSIAQAAKLDEALLLDPWNTAYKAQTTIEYNDEVLSLVSAGPDKRFGTGDDFTIEIARRNVFALQGERLTKLLEDAIAAGRPLPGTAEALKALTLEGGLDLDAIHDPQGKPYTYTIQVRRRFYSVQVSRQTGDAVWTSPFIDYFSGTESRMEAALGAWTAGKPFPETEAEARQAFAAAGIDFDALRDPLGQPFQLRAKMVEVYTRVEKIKAGGSLESKSRPVTHRLRALQVLRAAEPAAGGAAAECELVSQFLHAVTEQSGSDLKPQTVEQGIFKGNTGAIGGTVTDQTGAVIPNAVVKVKTAADEPVASATTREDGTYLIPDLTPGFYRVQVMAKGFLSYSLVEVHVSAMALTSIDVELSVGAATQTVEVTVDVQSLQTLSAGLVGVPMPPPPPPPPDGTGRKVVTGPNGKATISEPTFTPRLRHVFEETAYWMPSLETSAGGNAKLHFQLPDSLTTWKLHALASTVDGRVGVLDRTFKTFQPFFVDLDAPQVLTVGDEIALPVNLRNYTARSISLPVTVQPADWFSLRTPAKVEATVAANGTTGVLFGFRATTAAEAGPLRIAAANARTGDAVEKTVRVHPDGEPRSVTASGLLRGGATTLAVELPADAIPGSVHADLLLYPNLGAHILHSMKAVLERPYGCGEQTVSSTYPSLLFLELLRAAKSTSPFEAEAQTYLQLGYDRLQGYFAAGGGLTYWGRADESPDPALTAYGIEFLTEAEPYVQVDRSRIANALDWLAANQQPDGSWKPHYGDTSADLNLYIASVLKQALAGGDAGKGTPQELRERVRTAVTRAAAWAATSVAGVHDPYANALRLRMAGEPAAGLRAELAETAVHDRDGAHWSRNGDSPFYGWGHAGDVETTALVLDALRHSDTAAGDPALANDALFYLLRSQDRYGIWYSGQATVRVLHALLPMAIEQMKAAASSPAFQLAVNGTPLAGKEAEALQADPKLLEAPRSVDLTALLKPGHNELVFANANETALASAEAAVSFYVPWPQSATPAQPGTQTGKESGLDFAYTCGAAEAKAGQPIECKVDLRRFGSGGRGMLLAEVGLPPGADVDRASLAKLLDNWTVSRYELQPDRIVFYLWSDRAEGSHFGFRFTPRYGIKAKAAPSTLSDYYNPDLKVVLEPQTFKVEGQDRK